MALPPGTLAPDFTLHATPDQSLSLSEIDGPAVLIFYPADWSPVCGDELYDVSRRRAHFSRATTRN